MTIGHTKSHGLGSSDNHMSTSVSAVNVLLDNGIIANTDLIDVQTIYVSSNGSDSIGDGSSYAPYGTIKFAMGSITDNGTSKRYNIEVSPGIYTEDNPIVGKEYVQVVGSHCLSTNIVASNNSANLFEVLNNNTYTCFSTLGPLSGTVFNISGNVISSMNNLTIADSRNVISAYGGTLHIDNMSLYGNNSIIGFELSGTSIGITKLLVENST